MPTAAAAAVVADDFAQQRLQLHRDGWTRLERMPEWEVRDYVERLHSRYLDRILRLLEKWKLLWMEEDSEDTAPGACRPGGLVARRVNQRLKGTGIFVYAAHPSQADDAEEEYDYSGPRWYCTCSEAVMEHYRRCGVAPPPPAEAQDIMWPQARDRSRPWLTEVGWTLVPENSDPQVMHADICSSELHNAREEGHGRYHHFVWKRDPKQHCTTNIVPGAFTEGCATWDHYDNWTVAQAPALIFDSEMLHRGGRTKAGVGWSTTLTLQVCSGAGWSALKERVSESLMWYTQPLGWEVGDAVDALVEGSWLPAVVRCRGRHGRYTVDLEAAKATTAQNLPDSHLRYRQGSASACCCFKAGALVEALWEETWYEAKVLRVNADGTYRVMWREDKSFTDALSSSDVRMGDALSECASNWSPSSSSSSTTASSKAASAAEADAPQRSRKRTAAVDAEVAEDATPEKNPSPPQKSRKCTAASEDTAQHTVSGNAAATAALRAKVFRKGWLELPEGLPEAWLRWPVFAFVESHYDRFNDLLVAELAALKEVWRPCPGSEQRFGAFAAAKVSERFKSYGVAVYSPGCSQEDVPPYTDNGPRWYVSVTDAAIRHFGSRAPAPPEALYDLLCGHPADRGQDFRARGLGWTLAPPSSDPQSLHADIWGSGPHRRTDRTRWPHLLWKRKRGEACTTQLVPGAFTQGSFNGAHFDAIRQVRSPAILVDSEVLHRGAPTPAIKEGFVSTLSIEVCTPSGWAAWESYNTGGTTKDPDSELDWRMLVIASPTATGVEEQQLPPKRRGSGSQLQVAASEASPKAAKVELPAVPWMDCRGQVRESLLRKEQQSWEFAV